MNKFFFDQPELPLLSDKDFANTPIVIKYQTLFKNLDLSHIKDHNDGVGCSGYSTHSMIKALIVKTLERIPSIPDLVWRLQNKPYLSKYVLGFKTTIPDESQFYRFIKKFHTSEIEKLIANVNKDTLKLLGKNIKTVIIDSKPIKANTKENNPKNFNHNLSDKNIKPKRNEQSTLSYFSSTNDINGKKNVIFFWGYRIHIIFGGDRENQLPLVFKLYPNNVKDNTAAENLFNKLKRYYHIYKSDEIVLIADKGYDAYNVYHKFYELFNGKEIIPTNIRNTKNTDNKIPVCKAKHKMKYSGSWYDKIEHRTRFKFVCPFKNSKHIDILTKCDFRKSDYGCTKYLQVRDDLPGKVYLHQKLFKELYPKRIGIEQYNSVLQHLGQETPNHFKRKSIENTILFAILGTTLIANNNVRKKILKEPITKVA